jgi:glyoxylase I family protein
MSITKVLAAVPVADIEASRAWYTQLLGVGADEVPMPEAAEWYVTQSGSIQLVASPERAGRSLVTLAVDDLDAEVQAMLGRGAEVKVAEAPNTMFKLASATDPDGNVITFAEDLRR